VKPYYQDGAATLYHGDYREVVPLLAPGSFDLILGDPPYGDTALEWDIRDATWLSVVEPLLARSGSLWCFGSLRMFMAQAGAIAEAGWRVAQDVIWEKHNGSNFHADRFRRVHEHIVHLYRASTPWEDVYKSPVTTPDATARALRRKARNAAHRGHRREHLLQRGRRAAAHALGD